MVLAGALGEADAGALGEADAAVLGEGEADALVHSGKLKCPIAVCHRSMLVSG